MEDIIPSEFHLSQNYPNPFKEKTIIKYCIPYKIKVEVDVLNPEGKMVKVLMAEIKPAGTYQVEFDAMGLPIGTYLYRLQASNFVETKKMLLLK